ncbi:MAG: hypothetical protein AB1445_04015 [Bacillota bacterium]
MAECRWFAAQWLHYMARSSPARAGELLAAAACYQKEHDLMWEVWSAVGGHGHPDAWRALATPGVRREIIALILQAQEQDVKASAHLERALAEQGQQNIPPF